MTVSFTLNLNAQFTADDFKIETVGLSDEYAARYKEDSKIQELASGFNQLDITHDIAPIVLTVSYDEGEGNVRAEINYDHEKLFTNSDLNAHNNRMRGWGKGISVYLQHQIFTALSQYKKSVATQGWTIDQDLIKFESSIKLKKSNGDWIYFYAFNYFDNRGFYPYTFYKNVHIQVGGKKYETETTNPQTLNEMKFFFVGKTAGIDGSKTGAYYFCNFFNIETE